MSKKLVITADDFGISKKANEAILKAFKEGILTSTCIMANGEAFLHATDEILPQMPEIGLGVHLNIIEGKSLINKEKSLLCDKNGFYNNGFVELLIKSFNEDFLCEVEEEFRSQIEKITEKAKIDHLNSHVHTHAIPNIFKITCKLAQEYGIKYIRTQNEIPYIVPDVKKNLDLRFPVNLIKSAILNTFSLINKRTLKKYNLLTNDYFVGVSYTSFMDENAIKYGLAKIKSQDCLTEVISHPTTDENKKDNYKEFLTLINPEIREYIDKSGFELCNFKNP